MHRYTREMHAMKDMVSNGFSEIAPEEHPHFDRAIVHMLATIADSSIRHGVSEDALRKAYLNTYGAEVTARVFWLVDQWKHRKREE